MKRAIEGNNTATTRMGARDLDRILDGFGTRGEKQRLCIINRCEFVQSFGQCDIGFISADLECSMGKQVTLRLGRCHDYRRPPL